MRQHLPFLVLKTCSFSLISLGIAYLALVFAPIVKAEALFYYYQVFPRPPQVASFADLIAIKTEPPGFGQILKIPPPLNLVPLQTEFSLVIDKINLSTPVVPSVSVTEKQGYLAALKLGVAHAAGSALPSVEAGNVYLFAHSTLNPLEAQKYSAAFTLLHRLTPGDRVVIFYQGKRFDYLIKNKEVVSGFNTTPLTRQVSRPTLTLQTCDPPGIPQNRLIVTAELDEVYEKIEGTIPGRSKGRSQNSPLHSLEHNQQGW